MDNICSPTLEESCHYQMLQLWFVGGSWILSKEVAPIIDKGWPLLLTKEQEEMSLKPINKSIIWRAKWEREREKVQSQRCKEYKREGAVKSIKQWLSLQHCKERKEWGWESQRVDDSSSSSIVVNRVLSLYNQVAFFMDIGDLSNHVKYCVSILSLQWTIIRTSPVRIANN